MTNKVQLCRIIYYSLAALRVSSNIFAHPQEHLNCITASGITHVCRCQLAATFVCKTRSKHVQQPRNNKLSYTFASRWSFSYIIVFKLSVNRYSNKQDLLQHALILTADKYQRRLSCL